MAAYSGPPGRWLTGNLSDFRADRLAFMTDCARTYGDIVPLRLLKFNILLLNRPDLIEQVLVVQAKNMIKHFGLRFFKPLLGEGLVTSEGELWRRQRKLAAPALVAAKLAKHARTMVSLTQGMLDSWGEGGVRDVHADMMQLTLDIAVKTLFGADMIPDSREVGQAMQDAMECLSKRWGLNLPLPEWVPTPTRNRLKRAVGTIDDTVSRIVKLRRAEGKIGDDLLSMLFSARDEDGSAMSERQLQDEVRTILLAGHETTALTLGYAIYLLALNPEIQEKLRQEVAAVLGGRTPTYADLTALDYTRKIFTETLRLYPPVDFLGREAVADCKIGELDVKRGMTFFVSQWVMHHDARFFPEPQQFKPERWTETFEKSLPKLVYFPFGGGQRFCMGQNFALAEGILSLAAICQRYAFTPDLTYRLELVPNITLRPRNGLRVRVERRDGQAIGQPAPAPLARAG